MAANTTKIKTTRYYVPIEEHITYEVVLPK